MADTNQDYSFIMNSKPSDNKRSLPQLNLRLVVIILGGLLVIMGLIALIASRSKPQPEMVGAAARASEIARVSDLVTASSSDSTTKYLAATVSSTMNSEQSEITSYLKGNHLKFSSSALLGDKNLSTDSQVQAASQNNTLSQMYYSYLKANLAKYLADLSAAAKTTGPKGRAITTNATNSTQAILLTPSLKQ